jgi:hypothetical protein
LDRDENLALVIEAFLATGTLADHWLLWPNMQACHSAPPAAHEQEAIVTLGPAPRGPAGPDEGFGSGYLSVLAAVPQGGVEPR